MRKPFSEVIAKAVKNQSTKDYQKAKAPIYLKAIERQQKGLSH